jgi:hypothetical protein
MMPRGAYNSVNAVDRERLLKEYNDGHDWQFLALQLGIKRQTAHYIIVTWTYSLSSKRRKSPQSAISRALDDQMISMKDVRSVPIN